MENEAEAVVPGRVAWSRGDAVDFLAGLPAASVDAVVTDPPYPEIDRPYGRMTEAAWHAMMERLLVAARRALKPRGSAMLVLQPNSEHVGQTRAWLWRFLVHAAETWNLVQDAYWWNPAAMPTVHSSRANGLMRPSVKMCVWLGAPDCYRDQTSALWAPSEAAKSADRVSRAMVVSPSGHHLRRASIAKAMDERGGVTPFNLLPAPNTDSRTSAGASGHGAGTPYDVAAWWVRYLCPPGGVVADPFAGSGTVGRAATDTGRSAWLNDLAGEPAERSTS